MPTETIHVDLPRGAATPLVVHADADLILSPSVYDVPQSATIEWNRPEGVVSIVFKYVDDESANEQRRNDLTIRTGKNSRKLIGMSLRVRDPNERVADELTQGVDREIAEATRDNQRLNYAIVKALLQQTLAPLIAKAVQPEPVG